MQIRTYKITMIFSLMLAAAPAFASKPSIQKIAGTVTKISDGDTIKVQPAKGDVLTIRMTGMDTPELHLPTKGKGIVEQPYWGQAAADQLARRIAVGDRVTLMSYGFDKYGRTLARVFKDGVDINLEMVRSGWGALYLVCGKGECDSDYAEAYAIDEYIAACNEAVEHGRGIFNPKGPLDELPFEFRLRMGDRQPDKYVGNYETHDLVHPADYHHVDVCQRVFFLDPADAEALGYKR